MAEEKISVLSNAALLEQWPHDMKLWEEIRKRSGDTIILGFSRGKDSIATWLALRDSGLFENIIPYFNYIVPGLEFEEESIKYFEKVFGTHIYQMPHHNLYNMLLKLIFSPPDRIWQNFDFFMEMPQTLEANLEYFKEQLGLPPEVFFVNGVRAMDTPVRRMGLHRHGPFGRNSVKAIWNWSTKDVLKIIADNNIQLPVDYEMFGRSFDGISYQFVKPLKDRFPKDFEKIREWFPIIDAEFFRFENLEKPCDELIYKNGRWFCNYEKYKARRSRQSGL